MGIFKNDDEQSEGLFIFHIYPSHIKNSVLKYITADRPGIIHRDNLLANTKSQIMGIFKNDDEQSEGLFIFHIYPSHIKNSVLKYIKPVTNLPTKIK